MATSEEKEAKEAFVVVRVFPRDYYQLMTLFGEGKGKPPMGMLVRRALEHMDEMATEIRELKEDDKDE